jgi:transposase
MWWSRADSIQRIGIMAAARKVVEVSITAVEQAELQSIARSRTEPASRVERARILLRYRDDPSSYGVGIAVGVTHQTVQRCLARASRFGVMAALDDSPRPGKEPEITLEARAWLVSLACQKAKDVGYPHELWTTRLLARHAREHAPSAGHVCLARIAQGTVCKILAEQEMKPHKVRYYLERRDPAFEAKMAEVLCVYQEVAILRAVAPDVVKAADKTAPNVAFISYDEKPGIQAIANTAPDLPPVANEHRCVARDHEYKRHGTLSLLAGIDLLTGQVHACVENRHRSREFIGFLKKLDAAYPTDTAIKVILDNHSAHVSKETNKWLAEQRDGRFNFVFTPKHGSWLNLVEGFFSKMARSVLRRIRVASKAELKQRILAYLDDINREPVVHTWSYRITLPA